MNWAKLSAMPRPRGLYTFKVKAIPVPWGWFPAHQDVHTEARMGVALKQLHEPMGWNGVDGGAQRRPKSW
ncbi:MAG: hypothetical protein AAFS10_21715, partial [Myxococcota bacterium]